jgi:hypothetical protein
MNSYNIAILLALAISLLANAGLFWYVRNIIGRLLYISQNLSDLTTLISTYKKHLKALYDTEMYYGDDTIKHLIEHTNSLLELLEDYEDIAALTELPLTREEIYEENEETTDEVEKDVFYGGTRKSDN